MNLVFSDSLAMLDDICSIMVENVRDFVDSLIAFVREPIVDTVTELFGFFYDIPLIGNGIKELTAGLLGALIGTETTLFTFIFGAGIALYITYCIGSWITNLFL